MMKTMIESEYFEILLQPYACYEVFLDFVVQNIESCIEEVCTPYDLTSHSFSLEQIDLSKFFQEKRFHQIVIRTLKNPQEVLPLLQDFSSVLSKRLNEKVDFGFGYKVCQNKDWIEAYRQSIIPVRIGEFYIRPTWHPKSADSGLRDLVIDPALAFGSGHHATTAMCLELLGEMQLQNARLLDVGCGSGILSIASGMLGARVEFCDTDPFAIEESCKNFKLNSQTYHRSWVGSIHDSSGEYDVIVANILASILMILKNDFFSHLKVGGSLILSGILNEYKDQVLGKFAQFEVVKILEKDEWIALKLAKLK